jgi:hypothetical protein
MRERGPESHCPTMSSLEETKRLTGISGWNIFVYNTAIYLIARLRPFKSNQTRTNVTVIVFLTIMPLLLFLYNNTYVIVGLCVTPSDPYYLPLKWMYLRLKCV